MFKGTVQEVQNSIPHSQRVGDVEGDSDGDVDETGRTLVILVLLIEAPDESGNLSD